MQQMTCPKCHGEMRSYERSGITLEQCTECRGIFLDRGELERLTQAETAWHGSGGGQPQQQQHSQSHQSHGYGHDSYGYGGHQYKKKHKHFLEELFD
jgi:Zn-finger nucleic acid-binding protein